MARKRNEGVLKRVINSPFRATGTLLRGVTYPVRHPKKTTGTLVRGVTYPVRHPTKIISSPFRAANAGRRAGVVALRKMAKLPVHAVRLPIQAAVGTIRIVPAIGRGTGKYFFKPVGKTAKWVGGKIVLPVGSTALADAHGAGKAVVTRLWDITKTPAGLGMVGIASAIAFPGLTGHLLLSKYGIALIAGASAVKGAPKIYSLYKKRNKKRKSNADAQEFKGREDLIDVREFGGNQVGVSTINGGNVLVTRDKKSGEVKIEPFEAVGGPEGEEVMGALSGALGSAK